MILTQNRDVQVNTACGSTATYTMNKDNIPVELSERSRWVKRTSYKHGGTGWNRPEKWHTLDDIDGDAMFITTDTDLLVVDADHVVNDKGEWIPEAKEDYERIREAGGPTYEESSVSGHGRHLIYDNAEYPDIPLSPIKIRYPEYENWAGDDFTPQIEIWYAAKHCFRITGKITARSSDRVMDGEGAANALRVAKQIVEERRSDDDSSATGMTDAEIERLKRSKEPIPDGSGHSYEVARIAELVISAGDVLTDEQIADTVYREMQSRFEGELKETFYDNAVKDAARFRAKVKKGRKDKEFCVYSVKAWEAENPGKTFSDAGKPWKAAFIAGLRAKEEGKTFDNESRITAGVRQHFPASNANTQASIEYTDTTELSEAQALDLSRGAELSLVTKKNGSVLSIPENYYTILRDDPYFHGKLRYNQLDGRVYAHGFYWAVDDHPVRDVDLFNIRRFISAVYQIRSKDDILDNIYAVADFNAYHPVRELLNSLEWDGVERIADLLPRYLGAERSAYTTAVTKMLLYAVIQRVFHPGIKFDTAIVLSDTKQGSGKSTLCRLLALQDEWYTDSLDDLNDNKRAFEALRGHIICELGEMIATRRARDIETIKGYLSRTADDYRTPHAKFTERYPRQAVFIGTSNRSQFLPDDRSGNRRFIPVLCDGNLQKIHPMSNVDEAREYIRQCYAEAMIKGKQEGFPLVLSKEHEDRLKRLQEISAPEDTKVGLIQDWLDSTKPTFVCTKMIYDYALPSIVYCNHSQGNTPDKWELQEIAEIMNTSIDGYVKYMGVDGNNADVKKRFKEYGAQRAWMRAETVPTDVPKDVPTESKTVPSETKIDEFTMIRENESSPFD